MKEVTLDFVIQLPVEKVYQIVANFDCYQEYADAVNSVEVTAIDHCSCTSAWEVSFRDGILKWTEEDHFFPEQYRIEFSQLKGDLDIFTGYWEAVKLQSNTTQLTFKANFDLGLPQLASLLEPIAQKALEENILSIVSGLFKGKLYKNEALFVEGNKDKLADIA